MSDNSCYVNLEHFSTIHMCGTLHSVSYFNLSTSDVACSEHTASLPHPSGKSMRSISGRWRGTLLECGRRIDVLGRHGGVPGKVELRGAGGARGR